MALAVGLTSGCISEREAAERAAARPVYDDEVGEVAVTRLDGRLFLLSRCGLAAVFNPRAGTVVKGETTITWSATGAGPEFAAPPSTVDAWFNGYPIGETDGLWTETDGTWIAPTDPDTVVMVSAGLLTGVTFRWGDLVDGKILLATGEVVEYATAPTYGFCADPPELRPVDPNNPTTWFPTTTEG
jgi:hypothetical protein